MDIESWDSVFVRARRRDVHPVLRDPVTYGQWWPGVGSEPAKGGARLILSPPRLGARALLRRQPIDVRIVKDRTNLGIDLHYRGALEGAAEWFYLDEPTGITVHYLLRARVPDRGWRRTLADHRAVVRAALHELKDRFEGDRTPGAEPDAQLLDDQRAAIAEFEAGVEAWARRQAAEQAEG
ncbi:MAG: hypothetical protein GEU81_09795 [Nitriliruptorales bacterium]|nr:hypothetical protein [Nitriliruptorales bacterium]